MKMIRMGLVAAAMFVGTATLAHAQDAQQGAPRRGFNVVTMIKDSVSGLTTEQKTKLDAIASKYQVKMDSVRAAANGDRQAMMQGMQPLRQQQNEEIKAVLTADQQAQLEKIQAAMRANMGGRRPQD